MSKTSASGPPPVIHQCNLQCHSMSPDKMDYLGIENDMGRWLPFSFHMDMVNACKMTTDDIDDPAYGLTTVFTDQGDNYIIDTPYSRFLKIFLDYYAIPEDPGPETLDL